MQQLIVVAPIVGFIGSCLVFSAVSVRVLGPPAAAGPDRSATESELVRRGPSP